MSIGCREEEKVNRDAPNGPYFERLNSSGKRVMIYDADDKPALKLRRMSRKTKVYSKEDLTVLGYVVEGERGLAVARPDGSESRLVSGQDTMEVEGRVSVERVTDGWAILDAAGTTLGYIARVDENAWTLRDDYSSKPRYRALREDGRLVVRAGSELAYYTYDPKLTEPEILALTLDGLDPLSRTILAKWLAKRHSEI